MRNLAVPIDSLPAYTTGKRTHLLSENNATKNGSVFFFRRDDLISTLTAVSAR
jgi:hypothetical protein